VACTIILQVIFILTNRACVFIVFIRTGFAKISNSGTVKFTTAIVGRLVLLITGSALVIFIAGCALRMEISAACSTCTFTIQVILILTSGTCVFIRTGFAIISNSGTVNFTTAIVGRLVLLTTASALVIFIAGCTLRMEFSACSTCTIIIQVILIITTRACVFIVCIRTGIAMISNSWTIKFTTAFGGSLVLLIAGSAPLIFTAGCTLRMETSACSTCTITLQVILILTSETCVFIVCIRTGLAMISDSCTVKFTTATGGCLVVLFTGSALVTFTAGCTLRMKTSTRFA